MHQGEIRFWLESVFRYQHGGYYRLERSPDSTAPGITTRLEDQARYERLSEEGLIAVATKVLPFNHVVLTDAGHDLLHSTTRRLPEALA